MCPDACNPEMWGANILRDEPLANELWKPEGETMITFLFTKILFSQQRNHKKGELISPSQKMQICN